MNEAQSKRPALLSTRLSIMMFLEFFIWGIWFVPLWKYLYSANLGFTDAQVGLAYGSTAIAAMISPFIVCLLADRFVPSQIMLAVLHLAGGVLMWFLADQTTWGPFYTVLLLYTITYMPTLALVNSLSFENMKQPEREFPPIRTLGTIGWIVSGLLIGSAFYASDVLTFQLPEFLSGKKVPEGWTDAGASNLPMKISAIASIVLGVFCFLLPHTPPKLKGQKVTISDVLGLRALALMKDRNVLIFVLSSFLICIPLAFYYQSANGFLSVMGMENSEWKMTYGQIMEIIFLLLVPVFYRRLGVKKMLLIGMLCWVLRYVLFANVTSGAFLLMYGGILLHGICYDFFFVTGQLYIDEKAPRDVRASAQGFIAFITLGVGMFIGNLVNGFWKGRNTEGSGADAVVNWSSVWYLPAALAAVVLVLFFILFKSEMKKKETA